MKKLLMVFACVFMLNVVAEARTYVLYKMNGGYHLAVLTRDIDCDTHEWSVEVIDCWNGEMVVNIPDGTTPVAANVERNGDITAGGVIIGTTGIKK